MRDVVRVLARAAGPKQSLRLLRHHGRCLAMTLWLIVLFFGCSPDAWRANFHMVRAEDRVDKAYELRTKKVSYEKRLALYREACRHFVKAYRADPDVFTLYRIHMALDACKRVKDSEAEELFLEFEETYASGHPTEVEFGDAMPPPLEG